MSQVLAKVMAMQNSPTPAQTTNTNDVPVGPIPTSVALGIAEAPGGRYVVMTFNTPTGQAHYFVDADSAKALADGLKIAIIGANTGPTIASGGGLVK